MNYKSTGDFNIRL